MIFSWWNRRGDDYAATARALATLSILVEDLPVPWFAAGANAFTDVKILVQYVLLRTWRV